jgi:hypothetical protein
VTALKAIKADTKTLELQNEIFKRVKGQPGFCGKEKDLSK